MSFIIKLKSNWYSYDVQVYIVMFADVEFLPTPPGKPSKYLPVIYFNDYWNLNSEYTPINETTK